MARLIDADVLTDDVILHYLGRPHSSCLPDIRDMLAETPTVDAEPAVHARWMPNGMPNVYGGIVCECTHCGEMLIIHPNQFHREKYCCFCGAKMDEEVKHETDI